MLAAENPFAQPSPLTDEYPQFDRIRFEHYRPAFEAGMAEQLAEIETIASSPEPATFDNTVEALERSGALLRRVADVFFNLVSSDSTPQLRALDAELAGPLAAHNDAILLHEGLFARLERVHQERQHGGLDAEQVDLVERLHTDFVRAGAALSVRDREQLMALNARLAELGAQFGNRLLDDTNDLAVHVTDVAELDGLSDDAVEGAAEAARARGLDGYLLTLVLPTKQPALASLTDRRLRRRLHEASVSRGSRGNEHDTRAILAEMAHIRAQAAALHGFPSHAAYVVADQTAGTVEAVGERLAALAGPAVRNARAEQAELEAALAADGVDGPLQPWDWAHYAEKVAAAKESFDDADVRPYFEMSRVLHDGIFFAAGRLYGLTFVERHDLPLPHPDAEVFEVSDADGNHLGLFVCDWFTRDSKRGGAWMSEFVGQSRLLGTRPVVTVNMNVAKPAPGKPALMTRDEVDTAFHEFGHALHGLLSDCTYPRTSGTNVPRDFVEFPSQVNEMWAWWPEVLASYAVHHATGEPLSEGVAARLAHRSTFGEGFATSEYLGAALLDWEWHSRSADGGPVSVAEVEEFEHAALDRHGLLDPLVPPRYRSSYFNHVFGAAHGYDAGYYGYIWSEVLDADTVEWMKDNGGLRRENGDRFREVLLSRGDTRDVMAATVELLGREPRLEPLLRRRGLT
ncbi:MAG TPA: M3 family metallopeptidase [Marmoricola sp.]|nr:M3 family metallopeptidase [Marmoricola sp.]